jgi:hypothetical protein
MSDIITEQVGRALDEATGVKPLPPKNVEPVGKPAFPTRALDNSAAGQAPIIPHEE